MIDAETAAFATSGLTTLVSKNINNGRQTCSQLPQTSQQRQFSRSGKAKRGTWASIEEEVYRELRELHPITEADRKEMWRTFWQQVEATKRR